MKAEAAHAEDHAVEKHQGVPFGAFHADEDIERALARFVVLPQFFIEFQPLGSGAGKLVQFALAQAIAVEFEQT